MDVTKIYMFMEINFTTGPFQTKLIQAKMQELSNKLKRVRCKQFIDHYNTAVVQFSPPPPKKPLTNDQ